MLNACHDTITPEPEQATEEQGQASASASKRMYDRRRAAGQCVTCTAPSKDAVHCDACAKIHAGEYRERYQRALDQGRCARCKEPPEEGYTLCKRHRIDARERQARIRERKNKELGRVVVPRTRRAVDVVAALDARES